MSDFFSGTGAQTEAPGPPPGFVPPPPGGFPLPVPQPVPQNPFPPQAFVPPQPAPYRAGSSGRPAGAKVAAGLGAAAVLGVGVLAWSATHGASLPPKPLSERTTVSLPSMIGGIPRLPGEGAADAEKFVATMVFSGPGEHLTGMYGFVDNPSFLVTVTQRPSSAVQQAAYLREIAEEEDIVLTSTDPGRLGGRMQCGTRRGGFAMCAFVDEAAYGAVVVMDGADLATMARAAREAVERRTS